MSSPLCLISGAQESDTSIGGGGRAVALSMTANMMTPFTESEVALHLVVWNAQLWTNGHKARESTLQLKL